MKVMITGAAGFLGSHLMLHHLKQGDQVLGVDNYCSSDRKSDHVKEIINACEGNKGMLLEADITAKEEIYDCVDDFRASGFGERFDVIYNFACPASPPQYQAMPLLTMSTCVVGTSTMLDLADAHHAVLVHASTSEVYGDPSVSPQPESYRGCVNSYGPRACYDEGKRAAEALCYDYLHSYDVDARLVRIFNTYGPHMDPHDGRVVSNFICQALAGERLTVYGDGSQSRSFCYVDDLIRGIVAVGALPDNPRGPINLGNPNEFTVKELARQVVMKVENGPNWDYLDRVLARPLPTDDPTQRQPDISRAKQLLGWEPKVQLEQGLDKTIEYFRKVTSKPT